MTDCETVKRPVGRPGKRSRKGSPAAVRRQRLRYRATYPEKHRAQKKLNKAVAAGRIVKPVRCEECRRRFAKEAHHFDYSKPLEVLWVCRECHREIHRTLSAIAGEKRCFAA